MSAGRDLALQIQSDPAHLAPVREAIRKWTTENGWTEHDTADIVLAVDEALTNVIRHAYDGQPGKRILINVRATSDDQRGAGMEITIRDFGKQVPIEQICGRDLEDLRPGGLGVHIIRNVMDHAEYRHINDGGMELFMRKFQVPAEDTNQTPGEQTDE